MSEIKQIPIGKIRPYERNPRRNDASVDAVANSIKEFGFRAPIITDGDMVIIAGHTRWKAAKKLGLKTVPVIVADDLTPQQAEAYRIADNSAGSASTWDYEILAEELAELDYSMSDFGLDDGNVLLSDAFGEDFILPDGDRESGRVMTFTLTPQQMEIIEGALNKATGEGYEMDNDDERGNKITEVCSRWLALRT